MAQSELEQHVAGAVRSKITDKDEKDLQVVGFDFLSLIGILLPVLTQLLSNCIKTPTVEEVAARLKKGENDNKVKQAAWIAAGKATDGKVGKATQLRISQGLCEACSTATDAQRVEFVTGIKEASEDGLLV